MKIGILTYHRAWNYGAYLQACALCNRLNQEPDLDAEVIDFRMACEQKFYEVRAFSFRRIPYLLRILLNGKYRFYQRLEAAFLRARANPVLRKSPDELTSDDPAAFTRFVQGKYDAIVAGSDEIWKVDGLRGFPTPYWLPGDLQCRKFAYAASARVDFAQVLSPAQYGRLRELVADFEFLGVRDDFTAREIRKAASPGQPVVQCCDPSFLYDFGPTATRILPRLHGRRDFDARRPTLLVMVDNKRLAREIVEGCRGKYNLVSVFLPYRGCINLPDLDPLEWLALIQEADFVAASFFHAICFSIVYNRPFLAVGTNFKRSKLTELLDTPELRRRYVDFTPATLDFPRLIAERLAPVDFSATVAERRQSFTIFLQALRRQPPTAPTTH